MASESGSCSNRGPKRIRTHAHRQAVIAKFSIKKTPAKKVVPASGTTAKRKRKTNIVPENLRESLYSILRECDLKTMTFTQASHEPRPPATQLNTGHGLGCLPFTTARFAFEVAMFIRCRCTASCYCCIRA